MRAVLLANKTDLPPPDNPPPGDYFLTPGDPTDSLRRVIGAGAQYAAASHEEAAAWLKWSGASFNNSPGQGWSVTTVDGLPSCPLQTVTRRPGTGSPSFSFQVRHPDNLDTGPEFSGGYKTDRSGIFYERPTAAHPTGRWFESWQHDNETGVWLSSSYAAREGNALSYGPTASRGICASGISIVQTIFRLHEWLAIGGCRRALGLGCPSKAAHGSPQILGPSTTWPATDIDNSGKYNLGKSPYGRRWGLLPPWLGGKTADELGLSVVGQMLYWTLLYFGAVTVDQSGGISFRCDQTIPEALRAELSRQYAKLHRWLRPILNVRSADATTGGGAPILT